MIHLHEGKVLQSPLQMGVETQRALRGGFATGWTRELTDAAEKQIFISDGLALIHPFVHNPACRQDSNRTGTE